MPRFRRFIVLSFFTLLTLAASGTAVGACVFAAPTYRGKSSDHFDGERFHDRKSFRAGAFDLLRWQTSREKGVWPEWIDAKPGPAPERSVAEPGRMRVTFINHATTLLQMDGVNVLTDPIWAERASPVDWAGPRRVRPPGIRFEDLPPIDVVVISHNHYDHMNVATLQRLHNEHHPRFITGLGNDVFLAETGIPSTAVDWGDVVPIKGLLVHSVANQHFSNRGLVDQDGTLWTAFVFEGKTAGRAYFAGDTGYGSHFKEAGTRHTNLRLAILPIGAYKPEWFMGSVHTTPAQAVQGQIDLGAKVGLGMHWGTFPLADESYDEPMADLNLALDRIEKATGMRPAFWALDFGEGRDVP